MSTSCPICGLPTVPRISPHTNNTTRSILLHTTPSTNKCPHTTCQTPLHTVPYTYSATPPVPHSASDAPVTGAAVGERARTATRGTRSIETVGAGEGWSALVPVGSHAVSNVVGRASGSSARRITGFVVKLPISAAFGALLSKLPGKKRALVAVASTPIGIGWARALVRERHGWVQRAVRPARERRNFTDATVGGDPDRGHIGSTRVDTLVVVKILARSALATHLHRGRWKDLTEVAVDIVTSRACHICQRSRDDASTLTHDVLHTPAVEQHFVVVTAGALHDATDAFAGASSKTLLSAVVRAHQHRGRRWTWGGPRCWWRRAGRNATTRDAKALAAVSRVLNAHARLLRHARVGAVGEGLAALQA
eukprot:m.284171 g.284171  ORF g.284171 m.284171 type:complete len:366 (-) comp19900_c0_seq1:4021-5118(-)